MIDSVEIIGKDGICYGSYFPDQADQKLEIRLGNKNFEKELEEKLEEGYGEDNPIDIINIVLEKLADEGVVIK
jgi:hypothetical protein